MTATMPPAWTQLQLDQLAAEHHATPDPRHRGRYAIETPAGTLRLTAFVRDAGTTWLQLDRSECDPLPASAQDWLNAHVVPYLVRHIADGGPGGLGPSAGPTSGTVLVPTYDAAAALAEWLTRELAWQTGRHDPASSAAASVDTSPDQLAGVATCTRAGCARPARGLTPRHELHGASIGEHDCSQCAQHCELERYMIEHSATAAASGLAASPRPPTTGRAQQGPHDVRGRPETVGYDDDRPAS